jgi:hypothetical protein
MKSHIPAGDAVCFVLGFITLVLFSLAGLA